MLISSVLISREYSRYMRKRFSECQGFLSFMTHIRIQVGCFLRPVRELAAGFTSKPLSECGFIDALKDSENIYEAYKKSEARLSLSPQERGVLENLFSLFGEGYLEEGVRLIDESKERMEALCADLSKKCEKNIRLVTVVSVTAALGFFIIVI